MSRTVGMSTITIRFKLLLEDIGSRPMVFNRWLPLGREEGLKFVRDECAGVLWVERSDVFEGSSMTAERIAGFVNLMIYAIHVDISTPAEDKLIRFMRKRSSSQRLEAQYEAHGKQVFDALEHGVNRFLSFVRIEKGQYWLTTYNRDPGLMSSDAVRFRAKATTADDRWFRWDPTRVIHLKGASSNDSDPRFMRAIDWEHAQKFLNSTRRPTLALELLTGAEALQESKGRAALTEAVTALEVALSAFAKAPKAKALTRSARAAADGLPHQLAHLGFTGTVRYLLPLILPRRDQLPDLLANCLAAMAERNNVVHSGQRDVAPESLRRHLVALRSLCELLIRSTRD